jgi:DNA-binding CsgD family transcriptional regulator
MMISVKPSVEALSNLLFTLYAAPTRPEHWAKFLTDLTRLLNLPAAAILHQDLTREKYGFASAVGIDSGQLSLYEQYYGGMDPWRPRFLAKSAGTLTFADDLCPPAELKKTEFYGDFLVPFDLNLYCAVATIKRPMSLEFVSIYRGLHDAAPEVETLNAIKIVVPHIHSALQLRHQLCEADVAARNSADLLNSLNVGVVLLNERNECVFVSRKAESLCALNDGLFIRQAKLGAHRPDDHQTLGRLIERATAVATGKTTMPCGVATIARRAGPALEVSALALSPHAPLLELVSAQVAVAAVFIRAPDEESSSLPDILMTTYGLTGAEARLCSQLFDGCSLADAAERNRVSRETVRVQLRSIFSKSQVRRQSDLLRLCSQLVRSL